MNALRNSTILSVLILFQTLLTATEPSGKNDYEIIGLGSAFVDYIIKVNDEDLATMKYPKGSWDSIDYDNFQKVINSKNKEIITACGGSSGNVVKGLANLGQKCAVLGKVGEDDQGIFYLKSMENLAITSLMKRTKLPTAQAICFVTPDGQRTMRSLGAEKDSPDDMDVDSTIFENLKLFHIEGYQLYYPKLFKESIENAKKSGAKISIDLASDSIVKEFKDDLLNILPKYVDIVFANEREAFELTHLNPQEACDFLATFCEIAVVTMGDKGCWAKCGKIKFYTPALSVEAIDTTGAGDFFASGFLYGYLENEPLQKCAWMGSFVASKVVEVLGTDLSKVTWEDINKAIQESRN